MIHLLISSIFWLYNVAIQGWYFLAVIFPGFPQPPAAKGTHLHASFLWTVNLITNALSSKDGKLLWFEKSFIDFYLFETTWSRHPKPLRKLT